MRNLSGPCAPCVHVRAGGGQLQRFGAARQDFEQALNFAPDYAGAYALVVHVLLGLTERADLPLTTEADGNPRTHITRSE